MTQEYRPLVEVKHLKQYFPITTGFLKTTMLKAVVNESAITTSESVKRSRINAMTTNVAAKTATSGMMLLRGVFTIGSSACFPESFFAPRYHMSIP